MATPSVSDSVAVRPAGTASPTGLSIPNLATVPNPVEERAAAWGHAALPDAPLAEEATSTVGPSTSDLQPPTPEDVFNYIYGVLHTPAYREKYREFLKIDFPRIPYPKDAAEFQRIAEIGAKLVQVHLLKDPNLTNPFANPYARFEGTGSGRIEKVEVGKVGGDGEKNLVNSTVDLDLRPRPTLRVYINADKYFDNVPQAAWDAYIGGYQPAQKWLKDRKGRVLASDDVLHYKSIVKALLETERLMAEL